MRIGIEVEYWLLDDDGDLTAADDVIAACDGVDREMAESLLEVKTPACESVAELTAVLTDRLERVREVARSYDARLVPLGTPVADERPVYRSGPRMDVQRAVLGDGLAHAGGCAGTHLHFEQVEGSVVDQLRVLTALDPAFALVNTTPYYRRRRVAACARPHVYRRLCYGSLPTHGQLWSYPDSVDEWRERVDDRFGAFLAAARERGVDPATVEAAFSPAGALWTPVCLRDDLGTVEWRTPDAAPPLDLCRLAADVTGVVERAVAEGTRVKPGSESERRAVGGGLSLPPFGALESLIETAMAEGLSAPRVGRYLSRLGFDLGAYRPVGTVVDGEERLDPAVARRLRRRAADRFDADLERLRAGAGATAESKAARAPPSARGSDDPAGREGLATVEPEGRDELVSPDE